MQANDIHFKKKKHCSDTLSKATVPYIWKKQCSDTNVFSVFKKYIIKKLKRRPAKWIPSTFEILKKVSITAVIW